MKSRIILFAAMFSAAFCIATSRALAHRTVSAREAINIVERLYANHCGNGDATSSWFCDGWTYEWASASGTHSYLVEVHWREIRTSLNGWPRWDVRGCGVQARVEHTYVAQIVVPEWCWW